MRKIIMCILILLSVSFSSFAKQHAVDLASHDLCDDMIRDKYPCSVYYTATDKINYLISKGYTIVILTDSGRSLICVYEDNGLK